MPPNANSVPWFAPPPGVPRLEPGTQPDAEPRQEGVVPLRLGADAGREQLRIREHAGRAEPHVDAAQSGARTEPRAEREPAEALIRAAIGVCRLGARFRAALVRRISTRDRS